MSTITSANSKEQTRSGGAPFQDVPVLDRAKEMVGTAAGRVEDMASTVTKKADQIVSTAGSNIKNFGETIKEKGPQLLGDASRSVSDATRSVAGTIEAGGKYLEEQGVSGMVDDLAGMIKRNPVPAILVGVGLGILIGRALRS